MAFLWTFLQYIIVAGITVAVIAVAVALGINLSKKKDAKKAAEAEHASEDIEK